MSMAPYRRETPPPAEFQYRWDRDIRVSTAAMTTTGGHLWNAAVRLADYLEAKAEQIGLNGHGVRILELGSGVGWLGMCLAHNLPQAGIVQCTEQEQGGAVEWLQQNIEQNAHLNLRGLHTAALDWSRFDKSERATDVPAAATRCSQPPSVLPRSAAPGTTPDDPAAGTHDMQAHHSKDPQASQVRGSQGTGEVSQLAWDFIVGSDLIYNDEGVRQLPRVWAALATTPTQIYYAHTKRRFEGLDNDFMEELAKSALECTEAVFEEMPHAYNSSSAE